MSLPKGFDGDKPVSVSLVSKLKCRLFGHDWNDYARSWHKLDETRARIKTTQCWICKRWKFDDIIKQAQPSPLFDSFTTDRHTIIGDED